MIDRMIEWLTARICIISQRTSRPGAESQTDRAEESPEFQERLSREKPELGNEDSRAEKSPSSERLSQEKQEIQRGRAEKDPNSIYRNAEQIKTRVQKGRAEGNPILVKSEPRKTRVQQN